MIKDCILESSIAVVVCSVLCGLICCVMRAGGVGSMSCESVDFIIGF